MAEAVMAIAEAVTIDGEIMTIGATDHENMKLTSICETTPKKIFVMLHPLSKTFMPNQSSLRKDHRFVFEQSSFLYLT